MSTGSWRDHAGAAVRMPQIVVVALVLGCAFFMGIAISMNMQQGGLGAAQGDGPDAVGDDNPLLPYIALAFAVSAVAARVMVVPVVVGTIRRKIAQGTWPPPAGRPQQPSLVGMAEADEEAGKLAMLFLTKTIIAGAIIEGAAFFLLIAYLIEGSFMALGVAVAMVVLLASHFPTAGGFISWIERQKEEMRLNDQFG
jgi:amino acid transporter